MWDEIRGERRYVLLHFHLSQKAQEAMEKIYRKLFIINWIFNLIGSFFVKVHVFNRLNSGSTITSG